MEGLIRLDEFEDSPGTRDSWIYRQRWGNSTSQSTIGYVNGLVWILSSDQYPVTGSRFSMSMILWVCPPQTRTENDRE